MATARSPLTRNTESAGPVAGKPNSDCLVILVDRKSKLLVGGKTKSKKPRDVNIVMKKSLAGQPLESISPGRGKEFAAHAEITGELGVMFGAQGATDAVRQISKIVAEAVAKRLPQKALTKGVVYPIVKKVATYLGVHMTKEIFGKGVAKVIPVIGGIVSGGITLATYAPMSLRLKDYLAGLEVADPQTYVAEIVEVESIENANAYEE